MTQSSTLAATAVASDGAFRIRTAGQYRAPQAMRRFLSRTSNGIACLSSIKNGCLCVLHMLGAKKKKEHGRCGYVVSEKIFPMTKSGHITRKGAMAASATFPTFTFLQRTSSLRLKAGQYIRDKAGQYDA